MDLVDFFAYLMDFFVDFCMDLVDFSMKCWNCRGFFFEMVEFSLFVGAWWGQKAKMLVFHWFYHYFLKGQGGQGYSKKTNDPARSIRFWCF